MARWPDAKISLDAYDEQPPVPAARLLGYAGLIPFIAGAAWVWATRATPAGAFAAFALEACAATIAAFLGGVHWGPALRNSGRDMTSLAWGVVAQLAGRRSLHRRRLLLARPPGVFLGAISHADLQPGGPMRVQAGWNAAIDAIELRPGRRQPIRTRTKATPYIRPLFT